MNQNNYATGNIVKRICDAKSVMESAKYEIRRDRGYDVSSADTSVPSCDSWRLHQRVEISNHKLYEWYQAS